MTQRIFTSGWVVMIGRKYVTANHKLSTLLREAKLFTSQSAIAKWQKDNPQHGDCKILPARRSDAGTISLQKETQEKAN